MQGINLEGRKFHNFRPVFGEHFCLGALPTPQHKKTESKQNAEVSVS